MIEDSDLPTGSWKVASSSRVQHGVNQVCERCGVEIVRYQVQLYHDDVPNHIVVGRACANRLVDDSQAVGAYIREAQIVWRLRTTWNRRTWKQSAAGHDFLNAVGFNVTVFSKGPSFGVVVAKLHGKQKRAGRVFYPTVEHAKKGALEALLWARKKL